MGGQQAGSRVTQRLSYRSSQASFQFWEGGDERKGGGRDKKRKDGPRGREKGRLIGIEEEDGKKNNQSTNWSRVKGKREE